jgi:hypothetical protein
MDLINQYILTGAAFRDVPAAGSACHYLPGCLAQGKHFTERELP